MLASVYADYLPRPLPEQEDSNLRGWVRGHQSLFDGFDDDLEYVIASHQIDRADSEDLDQVAKRYGLLGRRFGRGDDTYRQYLKSLVGAYTGRGTVRDLKIAIGGGVVAEPEQIEIEEDHANLEFSVTIHEARDHNVGLVDELAEIARPAVVQRAPPITYTLPPIEAGVDVTDTKDALVDVELPPIEAGAAVTETDVVVTDSTGYGSNAD